MTFEEHEVSMQERTRVLQAKLGAVLEDAGTRPWLEVCAAKLETMQAQLEGAVCVGKMSIETAVTVTVAVGHSLAQRVIEATNDGAGKSQKGASS